MPNENIGTMPCPYGAGCVADVRRARSGTLYTYCQHGKITPNLPAGQTYIKNHAQLFTDPAPESVAPVEVVEVKPAPVEVKPEKPKKPAAVDPWGDW